MQARALGGIAVLFALLSPASAEPASPGVPAPRPRVTLLADNGGAETTDLLVPWAVLKDAGSAEVSIVATGPGPVALMPGLSILPDATLAEDLPTPDAVVVPAMHDPTAPPLLAAVRSWASRGALIVSLCEGARVLAHAGLLDGRSATSHWHAIPELRREYPRTSWRQDRRWIRDGQVLSSAGVSASLPVSQALAEILASGRAHTPETAEGPPHDGESFGIRFADLRAGAANRLFKRRREKLAVPLEDGVDELALGLMLDLWNRTFAVTTVTTASAPEVRGRRGLRILPDVAGGASPGADRIAEVGSADLDVLLAEIEARYGAATRSLVALQIEYPPGR